MRTMISCIVDTAETSQTYPTHQPELFLNRELSLLAFNRRVLEQAKDQDTPVLERLHFLCISNTNLDEFFEIRVASLQELVASGRARYPAPHRGDAPDQHRGP